MPPDEVDLAERADRPPLPPDRLAEETPGGAEDARQALLRMEPGTVTSQKQYEEEQAAAIERAGLPPHPPAAPIHTHVHAHRMCALPGWIAGGGRVTTFFTTFSANAAGCRAAVGLREEGRSLPRRRLEDPLISYDSCSSVSSDRLLTDS